MDTSNISFTALYTGQVWQENGMSIPVFTSTPGKVMFQVMRPVEAFADRIVGMNLKQLLLQRHVLMNNRIDRLINEHGVTQILEIACGLSPRGYHYSRRFPQVQYIEADLPAMAKRKQTLLEQQDRMRDNHRVTVCNIFETQPPNGLEVVLQQLDPTRPTLVLTEGLINYFSTASMEQFWQRLALGTRRFPGAWYLTDLYPRLRYHTAYPWVRVAHRMLGLIASAEVNLHYEDDDEICAAFTRLGFANTSVFRPEDFYGELPIPRSRRPTFVRIVEAQSV
jgi:O-methyltransferase involved in polyketide biosynthesis